jgi:hypothetical protein
MSRSWKSRRKARRKLAARAEELRRSRGLPLLPIAPPAEAAEKAARALLLNVLAARVSKPKVGDSFYEHWLLERLHAPGSWTLNEINEGVGRALEGMHERVMKMAETPRTATLAELDAVEAHGLPVMPSAMVLGLGCRELRKAERGNSHPMSEQGDDVVFRDPSTWPDLKRRFLRTLEEFRTRAIRDTKTSQELADGYDGALAEAVWEVVRGTLSSHVGATQISHPHNYDERLAALEKNRAIHDNRLRLIEKAGSEQHVSLDALDAVVTRLVGYRDEHTRALVHAAKDRGRLLGIVLDLARTLDNIIGGKQGTLPTELEAFIKRHERKDSGAEGLKEPQAHAAGARYGNAGSTPAAATGTEPAPPPKVSLSGGSAPVGGAGEVDLRGPQPGEPDWPEAITVRRWGAVKGEPRWPFSLRGEREGREYRLVATDHAGAPYAVGHTTTDADGPVGEVSLLSSELLRESAREHPARLQALLRSAGEALGTGSIATLAKRWREQAADEQEQMGRLESLTKEQPRDKGTEHLVEGEFQSDKYPWVPRGFVLLNTKDKLAQGGLREVAARYERCAGAEQASFGRDLAKALANAGYRDTRAAPETLEQKGHRKRAALFDEIRGMLDGSLQPGETVVDAVRRMHAGYRDTRGAPEKADDHKRRFRESLSYALDEFASTLKKLAK